MSEEPVVRISAPQAASNGGQGKRKPPALGRGLGALLGESRREEPVTTDGESGRVQASGLAMLPAAQIMVREAMNSPPAVTPWPR